MSCLSGPLKACDLSETNLRQIEVSPRVPEGDVAMMMAARAPPQVDTMVDTSGTVAVVEGLSTNQPNQSSDCQENPFVPNHRLRDLSKGTPPPKPADAEATAAEPTAEDAEFIEETAVNMNNLAIDVGAPRMGNEPAKANPVDELAVDVAQLKMETAAESNVNEREKKPVPAKAASRKCRLIVLCVIVAIVIAAVGGGLAYYFLRGEEKVAKPTLVSVDMKVSQASFDAMLADKPAAVLGLRKGMAEVLGIPLDNVRVVSTQPDLLSRRLSGQSGAVDLSVEYEVKSGVKVDKAKVTQDPQTIGTAFETALWEVGVPLQVVSVTVAVPDDDDDDDVDDGDDPADPSSPTPTPAPTEVDYIPAPTELTSAPTAAPTNPGDTLAPTHAPTTPAPTAPTSAPTAAPTNLGDTLAPTHAPTTPAPTALTSAPTAAPTNPGDTHAPTASPTPAPTLSWVRSKATDAQFLIQATFGPTRSELTALESSDYTSWIRDQSALPATYHRKHYRERTSPRVFSPGVPGRPQSPCSVGSRWNRFALSKADHNLPIRVDAGVVSVSGVLRTRIDSGYTNNGLPAPTSCTDNGDAWYAKKAGRSCANDPPGHQCQDQEWINNQHCQQTCFEKGWGYANVDCSSGWPSLGTYDGYVCTAEAKVGGYVALSTDSTCNTGMTYLLNPAVWTPNSGESVTVAGIQLQALATATDVMIMSQAGSGACALQGKILAHGGAFYWEDGRLDLLTNTHKAPASADGSAGCPTVEPSPVNEDSCVVTQACSPLTFQKTPFTLNRTALELFLNVGGRHVYAISNLRTSTSPCNVLSRWRQLDCNSESCSATSLGANDLSAIQDALQATTGWIREITASCSSVAAHSVVDVNGAHFVHTHLHEYNVYDFTGWVDQHPGGSDKITKWGGLDYIIAFPTSHVMADTWDHASTQSKLTYVGVYKQASDFSTLPEDLQSIELGGAFEANAGGGSYYQSCGSRGETSNTPSEGHQYPFYVRWHDSKEPIDKTFDNGMIDVMGNTYSYRGSTWINVVLSASDQLRQRVAWALSQIFVAGYNTRTTELWTNYYDILVHNALGNFKTLLREGTYSPIMGSYLTYRGSSSFDTNNYHPDENYAREIMQLFTIGLWKLNPDGTRMKDANGEDIPTYSNAEIVGFARIFTGFNRAPLRSNIEKHKGTQNEIDPMKIKTSHRDIHPKMDLNGGYIGDGYRLCGDAPVGQFLKKGARYRYRGTADKTALVADVAGPFYAALCGGSPCTVQKRVTLSSTVACTGDECLADEPLYVKVGSGFYEFEREPCVHLLFFNGRETGYGNWHDNPGNVKCQDPAVMSAGIACCASCTDNEPGSFSSKGRDWKCATAVANGHQSNMYTSKCRHDSGWTSKKFCELTCSRNGAGYPGTDAECARGAYRQERVCAYVSAQYRFDRAEDICAARGLSVCPTGWQSTACGESDDTPWDRVWLPSATCTNPEKVLVDEYGEIALVSDAKMNTYPVAWLAGPLVGCPSPCVTSGARCKCDAVVEARAVFDRIPTAEELKQLRIRAYPPSGSCTSGCDGPVKAYGALQVFEYQGSFYKNEENIVTVGGKAFRNPPIFMKKDVSIRRDAENEVEALLDHLLDHPNVPPFFARGLLQRLVTSNPSPEHVTAVATAFKEGAYDGQTYSGAFGDLLAATAACLLHEDARYQSGNNKAGSLREPILKVVHVLRSLEYQHSTPTLVVKDVGDKIGQMVYESPTVFNFFLHDFTPSRFPQDVYGPEFEILTAPFFLGFLNGMMSILDYGITSCSKGFGVEDLNKTSCIMGQFGFDATIEELDLLLTGGRLGTSRSTVEAFVQEAKDAGGDSHKAAQQAMLFTPEFHVQGALGSSGTRPAPPTPPQATTTKPYRATIYFFMGGGVDSFNLLVPYDCDLHDQYKLVRGDLALLNNHLLPITTTGQPCSRFAVHHKLPTLKALYDSGEAAFFPNVGALFEPLTGKQFSKKEVKTCVGLFSHSSQKDAAQTLKCQVAGASPKGAGGRLADALAKEFKTQSFSISGSATWSQGVDTLVDILHHKEGAPRFLQYSKMKTVIENITQFTHGNIYAEEYQKTLDQTMFASETLGTMLENVTLNTPFDLEYRIGREMHQVARLIATRTARKAERDLFYISLGGFDSHSNALEELSIKFEQIDQGLSDLVTNLRDQGVFDKVTMVSGSDFGRSLFSNGEGTDHAWAGNMFMLGGGIKGGRVYNEFPSNLAPGNMYDAGRGRLVPQYPWESMMVPLAEWMGLRTADKLDVFPNIQNFNATHVGSMSDHFN